MLRRAFAAWLLVLALAVLNGFLREAVLLPNLARTIAYPVSGLLLAALILAVAVALARWLLLDSPSRCVRVGALWLALTLVFEFALGVAQGRSLHDMLAPYRFEDGNLWPLVLVVTFCAPYAAGRLRGLLPRARRPGV